MAAIARDTVRPRNTSETLLTGKPCPASKARTLPWRLRRAALMSSRCHELERIS